MEQLSQTLHDLGASERNLSRHEVRQIAVSAVSILEALHSLQHVHHDIKPSNWMLDEEGELYLIDFALASKFVDENGAHLPPLRNSTIQGTYSFLSQNVIRGNSHSRRDDLEALFYTLFFLANKNLPFKSLREIAGNANPKDECVVRKYLAYRRQLGDGDIADEFPAFLRKGYLYVRSLCYEEQPDYTYLKQILLEQPKKKKKKQMRSSVSFLQHTSQLSNVKSKPVLTRAKSSCNPQSAQN